MTPRRIFQDGNLDSPQNGLARAYRQSASFYRARSLCHHLVVFFLRLDISCFTRAASTDIVSHRRHCVFTALLPYSTRHFSTRSSYAGELLAMSNATDMAEPSLGGAQLAAHAIYEPIVC